MRTRLPIAGLLLVIAGVASAASPSCVAACSCVQPPSLRVVVDEWGSAVFAGLAVSRSDRTVTFAVERWYAGPGAAPIVQIRTGDSAACGLDVQPGDHLLLTAARADDGSLVPSICSPSARLGTVEANALLAEAERTFGPGQAFGGQGSGGSPPGGDAGWLAAVGIGLAVAGVGGLGLAALVLIRRRGGLDAR